MASFNKVILLGNLTRDPELRYTPKGQAVARLGLAVNRTYKLDSGETREETTFIDIDAWGRQAELLGQYVRKGSPLFVEGRLKLDQWDDKATGQKVSKLRVVLENFQFIGGSRSEGGGPPMNAARPPSRPAAAPPPSSDPADSGGPDVDDVPF